MNITQALHEWVISHFELGARNRDRAVDRISYLHALLHTDNGLLAQQTRANLPRPMRPITDITSLQPGSVLYHSAFGFATVAALQGERVVLQWESQAPNLPRRVPLDVLRRVYGACAEGGFFDRAVRDPAALSDQLIRQPASTIAALLDDLPGPQTRRDVRDWITNRGLLGEASFDRWWEDLQGLLIGDPQFIIDGGSIALRQRGGNVSPEDALRNPLLPASRRLELALDHRATLPDAIFVEQVLLAWRTGAGQVKEAALQTLRERPADVVLEGLLGPGPESTEALIHAVRRGPWAPSDASPEVRALMIDRLVVALEDGGPLDVEGRLAAVLVHWNYPSIGVVLAGIASTPDGKRLLRATFTALPPRRAEDFALELLRQVLKGDDHDAAQWIGGEALGFALVDQYEMADRIESSHPDVAAFYRGQFRGIALRGMEPWDDGTSEDTMHTAEIELSDVSSKPVALGDLPPRSGASLIGLGLAMARALASHHKEGRIVNPTKRTIWVLPNETMEAEVSSPDIACPRPLLEDPSSATDVYAAAVLLVESLLGKPWPRHVPTARVIPYLRYVVPMLPPSALAPLDAALHPSATARPRDGLAWLAQWQAAALAEESRLYSTRDPMARISIGCDSHIGKMKMLLTQTNQDALFISSKGPLSLLVVCDGISTANAGSGDVASSIASHVIANLWEQALPRLASSGPADIRDFLDRALRMANQAVCESALRYAGGDIEGRIPMGTTVVCAMIHGNRVSLAWLGDSRAYLIGTYGASLLTFDENQASERLRAWQLDLLEGWDATGFALIGYLGHFNELYRAEPLAAHHVTFTLVPGERLVLCSDGVTDYIGDAHPEVSAALGALARSGSPDEAARALSGAANRGGGGDNITSVVTQLWDR